jgi:HPt (histidine-containing phosphotransfer) domain-containing protein
MEQSQEILDRTAALAGVGGDLEFLSELLGIFRAASPTLLHDIREALVKGDLTALAYAAHLVRITAQNVAARRVYLAATLLEKMATCGQLEGARQASSRLEEEMDELKSLLTALTNAVSGSQC